MSITFRCPTCHNRFRVDEKMQGRKVQCPNSQCHSTVLIPKAAMADQSVPGKSSSLKPLPIERIEDTSANSRPAAPPRFVTPWPSRHFLVCGGALLFVLCMVAVGVALTARQNAGRDPFSDLVGKTMPQDQSPTAAEQEAARLQQEAEQQRRDQEDRERQEKLAADEASKKKAADEKMAAEKLAADQEAERLRQEAMDAQAKAERENAFQNEGPFAFIQADPAWHDGHGQWLFALPAPESDSSTERLPLRTQGGNIELSLCEAARPLFVDCPYQLELLPSQNTANTWRAVASHAGTSMELGEYSLLAAESVEPDTAGPDQLVMFRWRREAARETAAAELLRWWPLQVTIGERSAVLLQRAAYVPETPLPWESLVDAQKIVLPRSAELQAIDRVQNSLLKLCMEIHQTKTDPQSLCLNLGQIEIEDEVPKRTVADPACVSHFPLTLPLELQETVPDLLESPLGFGTLQLQVHRDPKDGLVIQPLLELTLRLPGKEHLETFPSAEVLEEFTLISREPGRVARRASAQSLLNAGKARTAETRDNAEFWHRQPLRAVGRKSSFRLSFIDRAEHSIKFLKGIVRTADGDVNAARIAVAAQERQLAALRSRGLDLGAAQDGLAQRQQRLNQAETILATVRQLGPSIARYCTDMESLIEEFTRQHEFLMQDFDAISQQVEGFLNASKNGDLQLKAQLTSTIEIPNTDNGPSLDVYFVETSSRSE